MHECRRFPTLPQLSIFDNSSLPFPYEPPLISEYLPAVGASRSVCSQTKILAGIRFEAFASLEPLFVCIVRVAYVHVQCNVA
jgi:hypothetical protein